MLRGACFVYSAFCLTSLVCLLLYFSEEIQSKAAFLGGGAAFVGIFRAKRAKNLLVYGYFSTH
jgi:hypothetical protein